MLKLKLHYFGHLTHLKRPWCWEWLKAEGDDRRWEGWMVSPTQWTWVWVNSRSCWWTARPGVLQSMGSQRVGHNWVTELNWPEWFQTLGHIRITWHVSSTSSLWVGMMDLVPKYLHFFKKIQDVTNTAGPGITDLDTGHKIWINGCWGCVYLNKTCYQSDLTQVLRQSLYRPHEYKVLHQKQW